MENQETELEQFAALPDFVTINKVKELLGIGHATIYRYIRDGDIPAPVKIGPNTRRFRKIDLIKWAESRMPEGASDEAAA